MKFRGILLLFLMIIATAYCQEYQTTKNLQKDWDRLEKLLNDNSKDIGDKRKWAFIFTSEYGFNPKKNPHIYWLIKNGYIQFSSAFENKSIKTNYARDIIIKGNYLYLADGPGGILVFDISSPVKPIKIIEIKNVVYAASIFIEDEYLYIAQGQAGLAVWDISDIHNPTNVGNYYGNIEGIYAQKPFVYVLNGENTLKILDISDLSSIKTVSSYSKFSKALSVIAEGKFIYVADGKKKLYKLKFEDNKISLVSAIDIGGEARNIINDDKYIYLAALSKGVLAVDKTKLKVKGFYEDQGAQDLYAGNNQLFIVSRHGVKILDSKKISAIEKIGYWEIEESGEAIAAKEPVIYVANGEHGLLMFYPKN